MSEFDPRNKLQRPGNRVEKGEAMDPFELVHRLEIYAGKLAEKIDDMCDEIQGIRAFCETESRNLQNPSSSGEVMLRMLTRIRVFAEHMAVKEDEVRRLQEELHAVRKQLDVCTFDRAVLAAALKKHEIPSA